MRKEKGCSANLEVSFQQQQMVPMPSNKGRSLMGEIDTCEGAARSYKGKIKQALRHQRRLEKKTAPSITWSGVKQKSAVLHLWKECTYQK